MLPAALTIHHCWKPTATGREDEQHRTGHQHHVGNIEYAGPNRTQTDIEKVRYATIPCEPVDPVSEATCSEEREPSNLPPAKAAHQKHRNQRGEA